MGRFTYRFRARLLLAVVSLFLLGPLLAFLKTAPTNAAVSQTGPAAQISFAFDDALTTSLTEAAPVLAAHGFAGSIYVTTDCVGMTTAPNNCIADPDVTYLSWQQLTSLKNTYNWEVAGHSVSHPLMTQLSPSELEAEVAGSKQALQVHGFNATAFATPYGDYDSEVVAAVARHHTSHRGFHDTGYNSWPYNPYLLRVQQVQAGVSVETVKSYIDTAKANNAWLILAFHGIEDNPSSDPEDYQYATADLDAIAAYAKAQGIRGTTVSDGLVSGQGNLLSNSGFENGIAGGWTTDSPVNVLADASGQGSTPNPASSIQMTALSDRNVHLFSPRTSVDPSKQYWVSGYVNITQRSGGEFGAYIDEYDAAGNWISGQYKQTVSDPQLKDISTIYQPSSSQVASVNVQYIVTAGSGITAYVDNVGLFMIAANDPPPPPPPPQPTVLLETSFENGIAGGWTTDSPTSVTSDAASHGGPTEPQHSIKFVSATNNVHLFSPKVSVASSTTYTIQAYLNIAALQGGEVAFYIDEYDTNGNWISGQYIHAARATGVENVSFAYTPSSAAVVAASLQTIVTGNSGITAYLDDVKWTKPN